MYYAPYAKLHAALKLLGLIFFVLAMLVPHAIVADLLVLSGSLIVGVEIWYA